MASKKISAIFSSFFYNLIFVFLGTFLLHLFVRITTLVSFKSSGVFDMSSFQLFKIYSIDMVPNLLAYAVLLMVVYNLFLKTRRILEKENELQIKVEKEKTSIVSTQELTSIIVQSISECNNDIREWLERRKSAGKAPMEVELANEKISSILEAFTESIFLNPYIDETSTGEHRIEDLKIKIKSIFESHEISSKKLDIPVAGVQIS